MSGKAKSTVFLLASILLVGSLAEVTWAQEPAGCLKKDWRLAVAAYSFRQFSFFEAIDKTASLGVKYIESYEGHRVSNEMPVRMGHNLPDEVLAKIREKLDSAGVKLVNHYVGKLPNEEAECRKVFEFGKKMGIETFVSEPVPEDFDTIEKLCDEYSINVAVHNHPNEHSLYWHPEKVLEVCKGRGKRIGACGDTGHWQRSNIKPVDAVKMLEGKLICLHVKDLNKIGPDGHDVPWGTGKGNITEMLAELKRQNFKGAFSIEYEYHSENPSPEMAKCVAYFNDTVGRISSKAQTVEAPLDVPFLVAGAYNHRYRRQF